MNNAIVNSQIEGKAGCATYVKNGIGYLVAGSQMYSSGFSYGGHSAGYDIEQDSFFTSFNYPTVQTNFSAVTTDVGEVITIAGFNIAQGGPSYRLQGDDQWIMIDDYPGFTPNKLIGFNQDNNIYVGMGEPRDGFRVEFSKYNIVSEQWTNVGILNAQNNLFHEGIVFQVGDRIFVGTGIDHSGSVTNRMFEIVFE